MSFLSTLMGGLSSALSFIPGLGVIGDIASTVGQKIFGSISAGDQWSKEARFNAGQAELNRDFQKSERLASQEFNLDMWNRNNEYNSPAHQLERAKAAGINPNVAIDGMSPGSSSPVTTSPMSGSMASAPGSLAASMLLQDATISNLMANTRKTNADADNSIYELTWNKMTESERYNALVNLNDKTKADIAKIYSDIGMNVFSKDIQERQFRWFASKSEEEIKVMREQLNLLRNQSLDIIKGIEVKDADIRLKGEQTITERFNQRNIASQIVNTDTDTDLKDSQIVGQEIDNDIKSLQLEFSNVTGLPAGTSESEALFFLWCSGRFDDYLTLIGNSALQTSSTVFSITDSSYGIRSQNASLNSKIASKNLDSSTGYNFNRKSPPYIRSYNNRRGYYNP